MTAQPKVAVFVLCSTERTGWVNPYLVSALMRLQRDSRLDLQIAMMQDRYRVEHARNLCVLNARNASADICVMIDNDNVPPPNFADIILEAFRTGKPVVSLPYGVLPNEDPQILPQSDGTVDGLFRQVELAGAGVLVICSDVWRVIPHGPWFRWPVCDNEVLSTPQDGGEDFYFCELVRSHGLTVWTHACAAAHFKTTEVTQLIARLCAERKPK